MPQEKYFGQVVTLSDPTNEPHLVVPDDDADLPAVPNWLYVGTAGDVSMYFEATDETIVVPLAQGYHPWRPTRINETGTTADDIVAAYDTGA